MNFSMTPITRALLILMVAIYVIGFIAPLLGSHIGSYNWFLNNFALHRASSPASALGHALLHANLLHIGFNMMFFAFMGPQVERALGAKYFVVFSLLGAIVIGLISLQIALMLGKNISLIGYSGVLFAYVGYYVLRMILAAPDKKGFAVALFRQYWGIAALIIVPLILPIGISGEAHLVGLLYGMLIAYIGSLRSRAKRR